MKRITIMSICALVIFAMVVPVLSAGPGKNGANKVPLYNSKDGTPVKPVVGSVVFNVNANGVVIAEMHIDDGKEGTYLVKLNADDGVKPVDELDKDVVTINKAGKGNAHLSGDLGKNTQVRVNVLPVGGSGQKDQIYTTGWVDVK